MSDWTVQIHLANQGSMKGFLLRFFILVTLAGLFKAQELPGARYEQELPSIQRHEQISAEVKDTATLTYGGRRLGRAVQANVAADSEGMEEGASNDKGFGIFALFGGGSFLACAFFCPCFQPKGKDLKPPKHSSQKADTSAVSTTPLTTVNSASTSQEGASTLSPFPGFTGAGALTFTMAEINRITGHFSPSQKIGQGGFGTIYKGKLRDGTLVAVKRAKKDALETRRTVEFQNEVNMLSNVDHLNLVKLVGYLEEERERILVVEYVPNGNLREHLDGLRNVVLDFSTRLDIVIDVAHALTYLHLYADQPIIHRDVKSTNILLTDTFRAKVADFGFSREGPSDIEATHVSTQVKGTAGYLDPEYLQTYQLTPKSDVYSFGILLLEIFSGRRPIELTKPSDERITVRWAFKKFVEGKVADTLDPRLNKNPSIISVLERLGEVAFQCAAPTKRDRPNMKEAAEILWNIRKDFQANVSQSSIPRFQSFEPVPNNTGQPSPLPKQSDRNSPMPSPYHRSPMQSPLHRSYDKSPFHKSDEKS